MPTDLQRLLIKLGACSESLDWVSGRTLREVWQQCQRSDWMLWLLDELSYHDEQVLRLYACWCVRQIWHLLTDPRSREAVEVAERHARGEATDDELAAAEAAAWAAASAAWHAWHGSAAASAAACAADAAAWAACASDAACTADAAAWAACTADAAAWAAWAAADAAAWAAWDATRDAARAAQADRLREVVPVATVEQLAAAAMAAAEEAGR